MADKTSTAISQALPPLASGDQIAATMLHEVTPGKPLSKRHKRQINDLGYRMGWEAAQKAIYAGVLNVGKPHPAPDLTPERLGQLAEIFKNQPRLQEIVSDTSIPEELRKELVADFVRSRHHELHAEERRLADELRGYDRAKKEVSRKIEYYSELVAWSETPSKLDQCEGSRLLNLRHAIDNGSADFMSERDDKADELAAKAFVSSDWNKIQTLVVQHDWGSALKNPDSDGAELRLPYPITAFEFQVTGKHIIMLHKEQEDKTVDAVCFYSVRDRWLASWVLRDVFGTRGKSETETARDEWDQSLLMYRQIRAICIALDAEVAIAQPMRAPHIANAQRPKEDLPDYDYRVVTLNRKSRSAIPASGQTGHRKRLHFRRGHWRHFSTFRTWVRWTLVGDPELGFIDKEYRL